jgi:uncharacterized iron-regulated protein
MVLQKRLISNLEDGLVVIVGEDHRQAISLHEVDILQAVSDQGI